MESNLPRRALAWMARPLPGRREWLARALMLAAGMGLLLGLKAWERAGVAARELPGTPEARAAWADERARSAATMHAEFGWLNLAAWERDPAMRDLMIAWLDEPGELRTNFAAKVLAHNWADDPVAREAIALRHLDARRRQGDRFVAAGIMRLGGSQHPKYRDLPPVPPVPGGLPRVGPRHDSPQSDSQQGDSP